MNTRAASSASAELVRRELAALVAQARRRDLRALEELLRQGRTDAAVAFLLPPTDQLGNAWASAFVESAQRLAQAGSRLAGRRTTFDLFDPRVVALLRQERARVAAAFLQSARDAARRALLEHRDDPRAAARAMRDSVGLTEVQVAALARYRRSLEDAGTDTLRLALRDRRSDPAVERAALAAEPLPAAQVARMADRYRDNLLAARADAVAEGEGRAAAGAAFEAVLAQLDLQVDGEVVLTWSTRGDGRTRDSHAAMDGQQRPLGEPFLSGAGIALRYPHDPNAPASEVANCRCHLEADLEGA